MAENALVMAVLGFMLQLMDKVPLIASIAGYKRFRRKKDLWGPYASVQALEVGSYL